LGRCPNCGSWNSLEASSASGPIDTGRSLRSALRAGGGDDVVQARPITQYDAHELHRLPVAPEEFARVLGGGLVPGSLVLLGGAPGVGKSTLLTSFIGALAQAGRRVVYLSAEESGAQVRGRAERLQVASEALLLLEEPALERVLPPLYADPPELLVVDSIQSVYCRELDGAPGGVTQIRAAGSLLADFARATGCAVVMVGHVTKEGDLAGPRLLEHLVDTVLYFESDLSGGVRLLRAFKNRFGPTGEVAVLEMGTQGLVSVRDASARFLHGRRQGEAGSAVTAVWSGSRAFLVEIQALALTTQYPTPARVVSGIDSRRVALIAAILGRVHKVLRMSGVDLYVKVAEGLRVEDPAADLALAAAIASSRADRVVPPDVVLLGELGLTGELRPVSQLAPRLAEAAAHGFRRAVVAAHDPKQVEPPRGLKVDVQSTLVDALRSAFGKDAELRSHEAER
jgi:DNA repair protein RadA/Sms